MTGAHVDDGGAFELLAVEKQGSVLEVWLNRPDQRNAISTALEEEWDDALELAAGDDEIKVVTLQGRGPVFSAGADMKEFAATYVDPCRRARAAGAPTVPSGGPIAGAARLAACCGRRRQSGSRSCRGRGTSARR